MTLLIGFLALLTLPAAASSPCSWCVDGDPAVTSELLRLGHLRPKELLREIRAAGACVEIMNSGRKGAPRGFHWAEAEKPGGDLLEVTRQKALMGKTICKGEHGKAKNCTLIAIAHDAPFSTLLHEWLHYRQTKKSGTVCETSRPLWARAPNEAEAELLRSFEWDVLMVLWKARDKLPLGVEDRITLASEIMELAEKRKISHPETSPWLAAEGVGSYLQRAVQEFSQPKQ